MASPTYKHTQIGYMPLGIVSGGIIIAFLLLWKSRMDLFDSILLFSILVVLLICSILFASLTIEIKKDVLHIKFGPGLIRKSILLKDIESWEIKKHPWYYGWGIRLTPSGWLFNVSGTQAIQIKLMNGKRYSIGTDQPEELIDALNKSLFAHKGP